MVQGDVDTVLAKLGLRSRDIKEVVALTVQDALAGDTANDLQFSDLDTSTPNQPTFRLTLKNGVVDIAALAQEVIDRLFKDGGSAGQIPKKNTATNYDWDWANDATSGTAPVSPAVPFRIAVKSSKPFTAADYTGSSLPTHSGALPANFAVPANTFTGALFFGIWVPGSHPITSIMEGSSGA